MTENSFRLSNGAAVLAAQNEGLHSVSLAVVLPFCAHETAGVYHFVLDIYNLKGRPEDYKGRLRGEAFSMIPTE